MSFFVELKRRNVYRAGAAYVVVSWLIIQVVETIFPAFGFGDSAVRNIIIILSIGFVPVLVSAWAFELTPGGLKRESELDRSSPLIQQMDKRLDRLIMIGLALGLGYFAVDKFIFDPARDEVNLEKARLEGRSDALIESYGEQSIAVLAFEDMSPNKDQEYLSDGIAEELLNLLARIPELRVVSRSSAFSFKGMDIEISEIARRLNVAHILEGSVRMDGNRVRISTQLIEARSDTYLWSETYDRQLDDIFAIQDEVATLVTRQLEVELLDALPQVQRTDPEAYSLYLQARFQFITQENFESSISKLKQALDIDPKYAPAWVMLGHRYFNQGHIFDSGKDTVGLAYSAAENALRLDPFYAPAHTLLGILAAYHNDLQSAARHYERAFEINPNDEALLTEAVFLLQSLGRFDEAVQLLRFKMDRNPLSDSPPLAMGFTLLMDRRLEEAEQNFRLTLDLNPDGPDWLPYALAFTLAQNGKHREALELTQNSKDGIFKSWVSIWLYQQMGMAQEYEAGLKEMKQLEGDAPSPNFARFYAFLGDADAAFERLLLDEDITHWNRERYWPFYWPIEHDPRWEIFLQKMGVSDTQLSEIEFNFKMPN